MDANQKIKIYSNMFLTREFEQTTINLFEKGEIAGWLHSGVGQELVGSVLCPLLDEKDYIIPYHRSKSYFLARGVKPHHVLAEIMGRRDGICGGVGGEAHLADISKGLLGSSGILGAGMPISLGTAFKQVYMGEKAITICSFGDGSVPLGAFHETLNFAATWNLPIVFICENNFYAELSPITVGMKQTNIGKKAEGYGMPGESLDGYDLDVVYSALKTAIERARGGGGPTLLEFKTYRWRGHFEGDPQNYRTKEEISSWKSRDPLDRLRTQLIENQFVTEQELEEIESNIQNEMIDAVDFARNSPYPNKEDILSNVYVNSAGFGG
ncbi:MAG: thiamine pyrophosphate-dependent dehydrogenase E1 component subunit alpha [Psychrobacillus psychrodurans]